MGKNKISNLSEACPKGGMGKVLTDICLPKYNGLKIPGEARRGEEDAS